MEGIDSPDGGSISGACASGTNTRTTFNANNVTTNELKDLLELFSKTIYKAKDTHPKFQQVMQRCLSLFDMDYIYSIIPNTVGELSSNYPSSLVFLESEKKVCEETISSTGKKSEINGVCNGEGVRKSVGSWNITSPVQSFGLNHVQGNGLEAAKVKDLCGRARFARCRARFPVSVILYNNKHVCRSATLSGGPEIYGRSSFDYLFYGGAADARLEPEQFVDEIVVSEGQSDWQLFDRVRSQDIRLLRAFRVQNIVDLMVEKKKVKFGMNVTSSEKVDKENRYSDFNLISLPYPGCEFFKEYRDNDYCAERLVFEWNQGHVDANICVPSDQSSMSLDVKWCQYRDWDLVLLTQNYLKLLLAYLRDGDSGLLIHCISGWDRTPLFISLIRLSLWADGVIHKTLDAEQIMYLTLAYDWVLFGHNLEDRLKKGEEILYFCFNFLKYIFESEFSVETRTRNDSETHLVEEGILLEGETNHTSPEGSTWSISSCGSSQSSKSQDNPPTYFQVPHDSSWEDCRGAQHLTSRNTRSANNFNHNSNNPAFVLSGPAYASSSCLITNSMINSTTPLTCEDLHIGEMSKSHSRNTQASTATVSTSTSVLTSNISVKPNSPSNGTHKKGSLLGRTSPVSVPVPNRFHHHPALAGQPRPDSDSSASIGSWQMITGTGSLKDVMSNSHPSSTSSHSHPSRLSTAEVECIESSESSCTLVEELTPIEFMSTLRYLSAPKVSEVKSNDEIKTINKELKCEVELRLALDEGINVYNADLPPSITKALASDSTSHPSTPTEDATPTRAFENDGLDPDPEQETTSNLFTPSTRRIRLETVRSRFCELYESSISSKCRYDYDKRSTEGGLGFLIGNIASRVGIRSGPYRTNHM